VLRAAVIGCGRIGSTLADDPLLAGDVFTHAEAYTKSSGTSLVALCDTNLERLNACGQRWSVGSLFSDPREMMSGAGPDIVSICTPTASHLDVVRELLSTDRSPRIILCEKPIANTLGDAEELARLASDRGVTLSVIYMRRFADNHKALKSYLDSGALGKIQAVSGWYIGGTFHNGTHWFDMLRYLAGEVEWVESFDVLGEGGDDPTLDVALGMTDGTVATLRACDRKQYTLFEMDIVLEQGRAQITDSGHVIALSKAAPSPRYTGYVELEPVQIDLGHRRDLLLHAVDDAVEAITLDRPPACTSADGIAAMRIADAASRAIGTRVYLDQQ
jgi:predicted dehydrogenase